jgi:hypothetical protein
VREEIVIGGSDHVDDGIADRKDVETGVGHKQPREVGGGAAVTVARFVINLPSTRRSTGAD